MPTTLLLEGDDLEALLARARAEGGPSARIVRAEKIRHGGVLGFFAKERFEVAIEVPDPVDPAAVPAAPQEQPVSHPAPVPASAGSFTPFTAATPRVGAPEGLLDLADRADAAERESLVPVATAAPFVPDALDDALRKLLEPQSSSTGTGTTPAVAAPSVHPSTSRPEFTALLDQLLATTRPVGTADADARAFAPAHVPAPAPAPAPAPVPAAAPEPAPVAAVPAPRVPEPAPWQPPAVTPAAAVPDAYREVSLPPAAPPAAPHAAPPAAPSAAAPAPAAAVPPAVSAVPPAVPPPAAAAVERHTLGRTPRTGVSAPNRDRREDPQLAADRRALRALGVPTAWTRQLRPGDRFGAVLRMLDRMPEVDIDPATRVVAVVGPAGSVLLEAHRTALDLPTAGPAGPAPRPVVVVPADAGAERAAALAEARLLGDVVVAVEADLTADAGTPAQAVEALQTVGAGAVIAILTADTDLEHAQAALDALGQVDALAVEGTGACSQPAAVLQLGLPVVRLDGIPIDRFTWSAVLCAQLGPVPAR